jgi:hypothetical protein
MRTIIALLGCALVAQATRAKVDPVEKVLTMLQDLQTQVNEEGTAEATTYDKFACFCKSKTDEKTGAISDAETAVTSLVADLDTATSTRDTLDKDINDLSEEIRGYETQLKEATALRKEEKNKFAMAYEDMTKAVSALERAIDTLKASETKGFLQVPQGSFMTVKAIVQKSVMLADALGFAPKNKVTTALLEQAPEVGARAGASFEVGMGHEGDYDFHSGDIISTLESLLNTFRDSKSTLETDDKNAESAYDLAKQAKEDQVKASQTSLASKQDERATTVKEIAVATEDLTERNAILNDDRMYLKDLTSKCETKAKQWDQRSAMRADELAALSQAVSVLSTTVAEKATATGSGGRTEPTEALTATKAVVEKAAVEEDDDDDEDDDSFVQLSVVRRVEDPNKAKVQKAVALLKKMGIKLHSTVLSTMAVKVAADPFVKIKTLIQELIERLLQEEADEASHKGWCDGEIAATLKDRDYRLRDVQELHTALEGLNARKGTLNQTFIELDAAITEMNEDLTNQTNDRADEKTQHETTVSEAEAGLEAINDAIDILSHFYGAAAKAEVELAQGVFLTHKHRQEPGVDAEAPDAGFDGAYTGSQSASTGIMGMLEVIKGDFSRSVSETTKAEEQAARDFIEFERETKMSIQTKTTAKEHTDHELTECKEELSTTEGNLREQQSLLDTAVEQWEKLLPGCVTPGSEGTYEERVAAREAEVAALKDAYCILNDEEPGCSGVFLQTKTALRGA